MQKITTRAKKQNNNFRFTIKTDKSTSCYDNQSNSQQKKRQKNNNQLAKMCNYEASVQFPEFSRMAFEIQIGIRVWHS
jgi:hypothetical protein